MLRSYITTIRDLSATGLQSPSKCFGVLILASVAAFWTELRALTALALSSLDASHVLLVPFLCGYLIWIRRDTISGHTPRVSTTSLFATSVIAFALGLMGSAVAPDYRVYIGAAAMVVFWIGSFVICFGSQAAHAVRFPLLLLFLTVPPPHWMLQPFIIVLQHESAAVVAEIYKVLHVPAVRNGMVFAFPRGAIEITPGCSGIRSSIAFFVISLIVGHLLLRSTTTKILLVASILPILALKDAIRIVTLSLLGFYVDRGFLHGSLHADGGVLFFLLGIGLWTPLVHLLQRFDTWLVKPIPSSQNVRRPV
jgi:exosortase